MYPSLKFQRKDTSQFYGTLLKRVNQYFKENKLEKTGDFRMFIKTFCMLAIYFVPYGFLLSGTLPYWAALILWTIMGVGAAGIGFSIMHDANHGSYSKYPWLNKLMGSSIEIIGGNTFTWKVQHNLLHHTYTNIYELDEDIDDKPILRLSPFGKWRPIHKYQHLYAFSLYSLATIGWAFRKDFVQVSNYNKSGITKKTGHRPAWEIFHVILGKVIYFGYTLVIPILLLPYAWWMVFLGFVLMHLVCGLFITVIFQLAHVVEGPSHHEPDPSGKMDNTWAIHQLETTANFAHRNRVLSWFIGGLNYQIEHHLFPNICHIHYKKISEIVKRTAGEFSLPYYDHPTVLKALASHLRVLKQFGQGVPTA